MSVALALRKNTRRQGKECCSQVFLVIGLKFLDHLTFCSFYLSSCSYFLNFFGHISSSENRKNKEEISFIVYTCTMLYVVHKDVHPLSYIHGVYILHSEPKKVNHPKIQNRTPRNFNLFAFVFVLLRFHTTHIKVHFLKRFLRKKVNIEC